MKSESLGFHSDCTQIAANKTDERLFLKSRNPVRDDNIENSFRYSSQGRPCIKKTATLLVSHHRINAVLNYLYAVDGSMPKRIDPALAFIAHRRVVQF